MIEYKKLIVLIKILCFNSKLDTHFLLFFDFFFNLSLSILNSLSFLTF